MLFEYGVDGAALFVGEFEVSGHAFGEALAEVVGLQLGLLESVLDNEDGAAGADDAAGEHEDSADNERDPSPGWFWQQGYLLDFGHDLE